MTGFLDKGPVRRVSLKNISIYTNRTHVVQQYSHAGTSKAVLSPAVRCLGKCGLLLRLVRRRVRHQVAAHASPRPVVHVHVAVLHLVGDVAYTLREPFPVLKKAKIRGKQTGEESLIFVCVMTNYI